MSRADPPRPGDPIDDAVGRLVEAIAILDLIEAGDLLAELPAEAAARRSHQRAVSLLAILRRELAGVRNDLAAAGLLQDVLAYPVVSPRG
ncbi:hypothetical protein [Phenylobacterium sp.]|jgi:hypothetical protein|uniref:hypothetical protein n=1 Tax=Phenylobacterium sp. TaxID=1871053 RepID=UPI002E2FC920|nr:hypothetical protein [Phenylobacterium sp.]HEX3367926.1 hypothetical protein [Phenylobacterium sp.]